MVRPWHHLPRWHVRRGLFRYCPVLGPLIAPLRALFAKTTKNTRKGAISGRLQAACTIKPASIAPACVRAGRAMQRATHSRIKGSSGKASVNQA